MQEDITAQRQSDEKIKWLARHDTLTEIPNRFHFRECLEQQFECYDPRLGFALHWIDLDHFKEINDKHGHLVGDGLLKSVACRLSNSLRAGDIVGRLGGDEFAILQVGVDREELADHLARRILQNIRRPHDVSGTASTPKRASAWRSRPSTGKTQSSSSPAPTWLYIAPSPWAAAFSRFLLPHRPRPRRHQPAQGRAAARSRARGAGPALPPDRRSARRARVELRGAHALEAPQQGHDPAFRVHSDRRGDAPHRQHGELGAAARLHGRQEMAGVDEGLGQSFRGSDRMLRRLRNRDGGARGHGARASAAAARNHRDGARCATGSARRRS